MLFSIKIVSCFLLFILAMVCGRWPLKLGATEGSGLKMSLINCFAAGIFLGAGLIHTLSDSNSLLQSHADYPVAFALACFGFFLVFGFDRILGHGHDASLSPFILALVLGVHSMIAGIAVGLEQDMSGGLILLGAIIAHKGSASFALGASLHKSGMSKSTFSRTILIFSFATPLGILAGSFLSRRLSSEGAQMTEGVFDGLAAGTFLYVAIMEILAEEFSEHENSRSKYLLTLVGLSIMAVLAFFS
jgi:solute carrier family 39 (zinc transporter), member 1/2/3